MKLHKFMYLKNVSIAIRFRQLCGEESQLVREIAPLNAERESHRYDSSGCVLIFLTCYQ